MQAYPLIMKLKSILSALLMMVLFSGCLKSDPGPDPCAYDPCAYKVSNPEQLMVEDYLSNNGITGAVKHCSGMYYKIDAVGSGTQAEVCSTIGVRYKGKLANGNVFDETTNPVLLNLRQLIAGAILCLLSARVDVSPYIFHQPWDMVTRMFAIARAI